MGSVRYGGHELSRAQADEIIEGIETRKPSGHELSRSDADEIIGGIESQQSGAKVRIIPLDQVRPRRTRSSAANKQAVRKGHWRALRMIEDEPSFRRTRHLYEKHLGSFGVYLRPTEKGLTVISLEYERCRGMIGVSDRNTQDEYLQVLPPTAADVRQARGYLRKRKSLKRESEEERFSLRCVRESLGSGLRLPKTQWHFVHQEWRFPTGGKLDILAVDLRLGELVVIELKESLAKCQGATIQAEEYAALLHVHRRAFIPYFEQLARALARRYGGPEKMRVLSLQPDHRPRTEVWFPQMVFG